nr:g/u mismatch-specific uracil dna glycosylase [Quercus suber]
MPHTRSHAARDAVAQDVSDELESPPDDPSAITQANPPDFKTRLQRFQYASPTPPSASPPARLKRRMNDVVTSPAPAQKAKKRKPSSRYAPPSTYAHLPPLLDILAPDLICMFVGTNPGIRTAVAGHAYAHPSNLFWKLLHASGCTEARLRPEQDGELPRRYCMGNTNLVERASRDAGELSKREMAEGTPSLEAKVRRWRPEAVCIVGKGIWEAVWRWRYGREMKKEEFRWGWQEDKERMGCMGDEDEGGGWEGARVFVTSSTSGLSASLRPAEKEAIWKPFGEWVKMRRKESSLKVNSSTSRQGQNRQNPAASFLCFIPSKHLANETLLLRVRPEYEVRGDAGIIRSGAMLQRVAFVQRRGYAPPVRFCGYTDTRKDRYILIEWPSCGGQPPFAHGGHEHQAVSDHHGYRRILSFPQRESSTNHITMCAPAHEMPDGRSI